MGENHRQAGHISVTGFVRAMMESESKHLLAFANFIQNTPRAHQALKALDWAAFASAYNGTDYAKNSYDTRLKEAYQRESKAVAAAR